MTRYRWRSRGIAGNIFDQGQGYPIAIVLPGLPYVPGSNGYLERLAEEFCVVQPQYAGTYDSGGEFTPSSAIRIVNDTIDRLQEGVRDARSGHLLAKGQPQLLIAQSFGTWVALNAIVDESRVNRVVLLAPFLAMGKHRQEVGIVADLSSQVEYIRHALPLTIRMGTIDDWDRFFGDGDSFGPPNIGARSSEVSITAVIGAEDAALDAPRVAEALSDWASNHGNIHLQSIVVEGVGHSASELYEEFASRQD